MGKDYDPPIQEVYDAQKTNADEGVVYDTQVTADGENTVIPPTTLKDIYIKSIDNFHSFVLGKYASHSVVERQTAMIEFIHLFDNILKLEYSDAKEVFHHFLGRINESLRVYQNGEMFAPIYTMKKIPYNIKVDRFINLIVFLVGLAKNVHNAPRYVSGRDLAYIFRDYPREQRLIIIEFAMSIGN